jgi:hypothetical protein
MIRLDSDDAALLAMIAQYERVPLSVKRQLVGDLSNKAKPIGNLLIGQPGRPPRTEVRKAAERLRRWAQSNRRSRPAKRVSARSSANS